MRWDFFVLMGLGQVSDHQNGASRFYSTLAPESVKKCKFADLGGDRLGQMRQILYNLEDIVVHREVADSDEPLSLEPEIA